MKIKNFALTLLATFMVAASTACGESSKNVEKNEYINPIEFVNNNLNNEYLESQVTSHKGLKMNTSFSKYGFSNVDYTHANKGFVFVENYYGYVGIYSLTHNDYILGCNYYKDWTHFNVYTDSLVTLIKIDYEAKTKIIDNFGNVIYDDDYIQDHDITFNSLIFNGKVYFEFRTFYRTYCYRYDNGVLISEQRLPDLNDQVIPDIPDTNEGYKYGDLFREGKITDLAMFGRPGFYLNGSSKGLISLFNLNNVKISTFYIPTNVEPIITKDLILYQERIPLFEDSEKYSYFDSGHKYSLNTHKIDLTTGEESYIDLDYVFNNSTPLKDKEQKYVYTLARISKIDENKILGEEKEVVLDSNFNVIGDYSIFHLDNFIKLSNGNYYNLVSHILYNASLNPITYLDDINPEYDLKHHCFKGKLNGRYGLVGENGRVLVDFKYLELEIRPGFNYCLALNDDDMYEVINLSSFSVLHRFSERPTCLNHKEGVYIHDNPDSYGNFKTIFTLDGFIENIEFGYSEGLYFVVDQANDFSGYIFDTESEIITFVFKDNYHTNPDYNDGSLTSTPNTGTTFQNAIELTEGINKIHGIEGHDYLYVKVKDVGNLISLITDDVYILTEAFCHKKTEPANETNIKSFNMYDYDEIELDTDYIYYFKVNPASTETKYGTIELSVIETGTFTGEVEYLDVADTTTVYKTIESNNHPRYFRLDVDCYSYSITKFVDGVPTNANYDTISINGSEYNYVNNTSIIHFESDGYSYNEWYKFSDIDLESMPRYTGSSTMIYPNGHSIYSYTPTKSGLYKLEKPTNQHLSLNIYSQYSGNLLYEYDADNKMCYLNSDTKYFVDFDNTSSEYESFNPRFFEYLEKFEKINQGYQFYVEPGRNIFKLYIRNSGNYIFTNGTYFDNFVIIPDHNVDTKLRDFNGDKYCYLNDGTYYIFIDSTSPDSLNSSVSELTVDSSSAALGSYESIKRYRKNVSGVFTNYDESGYYKVNTDTANYNFELYELFISYDYYEGYKVEYSEAKPAVKHGTNLYYLEHSSKYCLLFDNLVTTSDYTFGLDFVTNQIELLGEFIVDAHDFLEQSDGSYLSQNHTNSSSNYMSIRVLSDCTLSFDYDLCSESSYDYLRVYKNDSQVLSKSGDLNNQTYSTVLKKNDILKIYYSKDGSSNYKTDNVRIYNIHTTL